ncbi:phage major tail protein, TP901-1 family [Streptococcus cristatus]|jgi:TP901-1 family phage major tail protein|uniref:Phage major tail protein 2 n=1 Tax=Streptococcus cristatus TaxID=45634 RepID=A0A3R9MJC9_STRCR|nr:phage major tail protein, TP901-1 family [Streptococcus cristatus]RSJ80030.1 Phage major tail protein 2 [Streptococcus cristatus]
MAEKGQVKITTAKPIVGKKVFYFIQSIHAEKGEGALLPAYRTGGSTTLGGEYQDEQTQQGRLLEKSSDEHSIELTQYFAPMDPSIGVILDAQAKGESIKIWRVIVDESVKTKIGESGNQKDAYPAKFGYAKITDDVEFNDDVEGFVELSYTAGIVGRLQDGKFPLSAEELALLNDIYTYQNPGETTGDYDNIQR